MQGNNVTKDELDFSHDLHLMIQPNYPVRGPGRALFANDMWVCEGCSPDIDMSTK